MPYPLEYSMAREGVPFVLIFVAPAILLALLGFWIGAIVCTLLAAYMAYFFRDPERRPPSNNGLVVSPADGRVVQVAAIDPSSADSAVQVSIFLSPLDVHINRSPIAGDIVEVIHKPGAFHIASRDIASTENEQNIVTVRGRDLTIVFRQIAGVLARRIVLWKQTGDSVALGERVGLMKFSSRMDVILPPEVEVLVHKGDRVVAGITPIGKIKAGGKDG